MGTMRGLAANIREALQEQYYVKLKHQLTVYNAITPKEILEHVGEEWTQKSKKELRHNYYQPWNVSDGMLLLTLTQNLVDKCTKIAFNGATINDNKLNKHYVEQMFSSKKLTTEDMKTWEEKDVSDQEDWDTITEFFIKKMAAMKI